MMLNLVFLEDELKLMMVGYLSSATCFASVPRQFYVLEFIQPLVGDVLETFVCKIEKSTGRGR